MVIYARHQWFLPVILTTWEAEIGRIIVQGQPRQKVCKTPFKPIAGHSSIHLSFQSVQTAKVERLMVPGQPRQKTFQELILMGKKTGCGGTHLLFQLWQKE
jgi:hypothetical protein